MRTNKKLAIENLEHREVFSVAPGFEGLTPDAQVGALGFDEELPPYYDYRSFANARDAGESRFFDVFVDVTMTDPPPP